MLSAQQCRRAICNRWRICADHRAAHICTKARAHATKSTSSAIAIWLRRPGLAPARPRLGRLWARGARGWLGRESGPSARALRVRTRAAAASLGRAATKARCTTARILHAAYDRTRVSSASCGTIGGHDLFISIVAGGRGGERTMRASAAFRAHFLALAPAPARPPQPRRHHHRHISRRP